MENATESGESKRENSGWLHDLMQRYPNGSFVRSAAGSAVGGLLGRLIYLLGGLLLAEARPHLKELSFFVLLVCLIGLAAWSSVLQRRASKRRLRQVVVTLFVVLYGVLAYLVIREPLFVTM